MATFCQNTLSSLFVQFGNNNLRIPKNFEFDIFSQQTLQHADVELKYCDAQFLTNLISKNFIY